MKAPNATFSRPVWSTARKDMVGSSLGSSRVWFTVAQGILTEVYYPRIDIPQIRDLGFIVADDRGFWTEVRTQGQYQISLEQDGVPAVRIRHEHERFRLDLSMIAAPERDVILVNFRLTGESTLRVYPLLAPRLGGESENSALCGTWHGRKVLAAFQGPFGLALSGMKPDGTDLFSKLSCGFVGESDGWQDFARNGRMTWNYDEAGPGEIALMAETGSSGGTLALGLASSWEAASTLGFSALMEGFEAQWDHQVSLWKKWQDTLNIPASLPPPLARMYRTSAMVLRAHEDKTFPGALIASMSTPWGEVSDSRGGYHLVWSRDLSESAGAFLAMGDTRTVHRILSYLMATQQEDGHWLQNQWLGGKPYWQGLQLDEAAFPVLLAASLESFGILSISGLRTMVERALRFIIREGPVTGQDRWEEDPGINLFTLAVSIAALVDGAELLNPEDREIAYWMADTWNSRIERWTWSGATSLATNLDVPGYYLRAVPEEILEDAAAKGLPLLIKNRCQDPGLAACDQISTDFLQLVRYGLRSLSDRPVRATLRAIDRLLRCDTPTGQAWYRYNGDGYGEHEDGSPFDGSGRGRPWPLLAGERGHAALTGGESPLPYLRAMEAMSGPGGMIPEQVWDTAPVPERNLWPGKPTGSAMPLVWAHAEFIKLVHSMALKTPVDRPRATWIRYGGKPPSLSWVLWRLRHKVRLIPEGLELRFVFEREAMVHWAIDNWEHPVDMPTRPLGLGFFGTALPTMGLKVGQVVLFTFYWPLEQRWEGVDYRVEVVAPVSSAVED